MESLVALKVAAGGGMVHLIKPKIQAEKFGGGLAGLGIQKKSKGGYQATQGGNFGGNIKIDMSNIVGIS